MNERKKQYDRERYQLFRKLHVCASCKQQDALTMAGRVYCTECAEKRLRYKNNRYANDPHYREMLKEQKRNRDQYRRENNLCLECGKPLPEACGYLICYGCRARRREQSREKRRKAGSIPFDMLGANGMCKKCGREPALPGKKLGKRCYESCIRHLENMRKKKAETRAAQVAAENRNGDPT